MESKKAATKAPAETVAVQKDFKAAIPAHPTLHGLGDMTVVMLRDELQKDGIEFAPKALKIDLITLAAMHRLRLLKKGAILNKDLLEKVKGWCAAPASELTEIVRKKGLVKGRTKWVDVENLVRQEVGKEDPAPANPPSAAVMNVILTLLYHDIYTFSLSFYLKHPDCPVRQSKILDSMNKIPALKDTEHVVALCTGPKTDETKLFAWICSTFGSTITEATKDNGLRIPNFPDAAQQFALTKPPTALRRKFDAHLATDKGKSMLLFHGTSIHTLFSILREGFHPAADRRHGKEGGLFMALEPTYSYPYAAIRAPKTQWVNTPLPGHGLLLGCEVSGIGRPVYDEPGVHVVSKLDSVIIRYVFLVPRAQLAVGSRVTRAAVEPAMTAGFAIIKKWTDTKKAIDAKK